MTEIAEGRVWTTLPPEKRTCIVCFKPASVYICAARPDTNCRCLPERPAGPKLLTKRMRALDQTVEIRIMEVSGLALLLFL